MIVVGDSFAGVFKLFSPDEVYVKVFSGATAGGLINIDSKSGAGKNIKLIKSKIPHDQIVFIFGNVDFHLKFYFKCIKSGVLDQQEYIRKTMSDYIKYISGLNEKNVAVVNIFPPTIKPKNLSKALSKYLFDKDQHSDLDKLKLEHPEIFSFKWRCDFIKKANEHLETLCRQSRYNFININKYITTPAGLVKSVYLDPVNEYNVHVLWEPLVPFWLKYFHLTQPRDLETSLKKWVKQKQKIVKDRLKS
jgi:hypothetical protein